MIRKNSSLSSIFFAFVLIMALSSCEVEEVEFVDLTRLELQDVKPKEITLDVTAILDNPNNFNIKVVESDLDLYIEGNKMGKAVLVDEFTIEKGTQKAYDLKIRAEGDGLQMKLLPVMLSAALTGKVTVRLDGTITGKVSLYKRKVPVDITEDVKFKNES